MMVFLIAVIIVEVIRMMCTVVVISLVVLDMVVLALVALVVLTEVVVAVARCTMVVGPLIGMVGISLSVMKRSSVLVGLLMMVPTVVVSIVVMGSIMVIGLTVMVGLCMVGRLTLLMEHTMIGSLTMVVGLTEVAGLTVMSSATLTVIIIKRLLIIGMVGESSAMGRNQGKRCGLVGSIMIGGMAVVGGVVGMEGESIVREVLDLTKVVRFTMRMGRAMTVDSSIIWSMLWG